MSYGSRTQFPSTGRTSRGRGRGRRAEGYKPHVMSRPEPEEEREEDSGGAGEGLQQNGDYRGRAAQGERSLQRSQGAAHYVRAPDPTKHSKLRKTASEEEASFARHKEEKRERTAEGLRHQPPRFVGGVERTLEEIKALREEQARLQEKEDRFAAVRRRQRREDYQKAQREKEEAEIQKKRQVQREKAIRAEARKEEELEEMRLRRLAYFDK